MRTLAVVGLVAACGTEPGLLIDVGPGSTNVASVEVFLPKNTAGDGLGLPMTTQKAPGTIYTVIDSVQASVDSSGRVRVLLQPGDLTDVPALLVLGYDGNHTPIASAVVTDPSGAIHLPHTQTVQLEVELVPSTYVPPRDASQITDTVRIARWSPNKPDGDLAGACIAVLVGTDNAFFSAAGDLDCDNASPECDDTFYKYTAPPGTNPMARACASQKVNPPTQDACVIGHTVACTDGIGTCAPATGTDATICVPLAVCDNCPNSDDTTGTSGLDPSCEMAARMDSNEMFIDCTLAVSQPGGTPMPCSSTGGAIDLSAYIAPGYVCSGPPLGFVGGLAGGGVPGPILLGGTSTGPDYVVAAHCAGPGMALSYTAYNGNTAPPLADTDDVLAVLAFALRDASNASGATFLVPFRLHYQLVADACPAEPFTCKIAQQSGDPKDDPMWHCAGR